MQTAFDPVVLDRAMTLSYVVVTQDQDFPTETVGRQRAGEVFSGVVYAPQRRGSYRRCIDDLELLAKASDPADMMNCLLYLPL